MRLSIPRIIWALILSAAVLAPAKVEPWTDIQGNTFKGEPAEEFGPLAIFRTASGGGRRLPWRARPGETADPYRVWLSEIMLQQTTVQAVADYYRKFLARWPAVQDLAAAKEDEVLAVVIGILHLALFGTPIWVLTSAGPSPCCWSPFMSITPRASPGA